MKKLLILITLVMFQAKVFCLNYGTIKNATDRDIWIAGQDVQCKPCAKPLTGFTTKVLDPFFRLEPKNALRFETGDRIKVRYYIDPKRVNKGSIAFNANSTQIVINSLTDKGLVVEGGNFSAKE